MGAAAVVIVALAAMAIAAAALWGAFQGVVRLGRFICELVGGSPSRTDTPEDNGEYGEAHRPAA